MAIPTGSVLFFAIWVLWCFVIYATVAKNLDPIRIKSQDTKRHSCDPVLPFFQAKNITYSPVTIKKGRICGGHCCDSETELLLQTQGQKDLADLLSHNSRSLLGPINRTSLLLQNHFRNLVSKSENKTLLLFRQLYGDKLSVSNEPIGALYQNIRRYIMIDPAEEMSIRSADTIVISVNKFFTEIFPLAYHEQAALSAGDFSWKYINCLKESIESIQPFGHYPKEVAHSLSISLEATRLLLHALQVGMEVLSAADKVIVSEHINENTECHTALLNMLYCSKCQGVRSSRPCSGYCLNVLRGCMSKYVSELDLPWNSYVEGVENLVSAFKMPTQSNVDAVIKNLDAQISSAIMYFLEKIVDIDKKVKMNCKVPEFAQKTDYHYVEATTIMSTITNRTRQSIPRSFPHFPETQFASFLSTLSKTKGFYAELADNLCGDETFADQRDKKCWNGERIGEYTKTVISPATNAQLYNPEVKPPTYQHQLDSKIAALVDKLRHVHHVAVASVGQNYVEGMQRDSVDGSGSGSGPDVDDDDDEPLRGSGSGNGQGEVDEGLQKVISEITGNNNRETVVPLNPSAIPGRSESSQVEPTLIVRLLGAFSVTLLIRRIIVYLV